MYIMLIIKHAQYVYIFKKTIHPFYFLFIFLLLGLCLTI